MADNGTMYKNGGPELRIWDVHPGSSFSSIPDLGFNKNKKEEVNQFFVLPFCSHKFYKMENYFTVERYKEI
jgi:hypothetical protein